MAAEWVDRMSRLFKFVDRPRRFDPADLAKWLRDRGITADRNQVVELRKAWVLDLLAVEYQRMYQTNMAKIHQGDLELAVYLHTSPR
jgi:hypothetical protein